MSRFREQSLTSLDEFISYPYTDFTPQSVKPSTVGTYGTQNKPSLAQILARKIKAWKEQKKRTKNDHAMCVEVQGVMNEEALKLLGGHLGRQDGGVTKREKVFGNEVWDAEKIQRLRMKLKWTHTRIQVRTGVDGIDDGELSDANEMWEDAVEELGVIRNGDI